MMRSFPLEKPRTANSVRVLSWNVYYGDSEKHADDVVAALKRFDPDVLALSELNYAWKLPEKVAELGYGGTCVDAQYRKWVLWPLQGGLALYSRFKIEYLRILQTSYPHLWSVSRFYIEMRLRVNANFAFSVGMTHHTLPFESTYRSASQALVGEVANHKDRYLLTGDLNALPSYDLIQRLGKRLTPLGPPYGEGSYPMSRWVKRLGWSRRVDYAFGTSDIAMMRRGNARFGESFPSDHAPIVIDLDVP